MNKAVNRGMTALIYLALLLLATALQAEIYRWVDKQGQVHFSDVENLPAQVNHAEEIEVEPNVIRVQPGLRPTSRHPAEDKIPSKINRSSKKPDIVTELEQSREKCAAARVNLEKVRRQLRAGYTARQYRRLHDREVHYMNERQHYCH